MTCLVVLIAIYLKQRNDGLFNKEGVETICKILDIEKRRKGVTTSQILATVEYTTYLGETIVNTVPNRKEFEVGNCYKLKYLKSDKMIIRVGVSTECR